MQELELTSAHLIRIWWSLVWRFTGLFLLIFACVLLASVVVSTILWKLEYMSYASTVRMGGRCLMAVTLLGIPAAMLMALRQTMHSRFSRFRIALLAPVGPADQENCAASAE